LTVASAFAKLVVVPMILPELITAVGAPFETG